MGMQWMQDKYAQDKRQMQYGQESIRAPPMEQQENTLYQMQSGLVKVMAYWIVVPIDGLNDRYKLIELINSIILGREDGTLEEELIWEISLIDARIECIDQLIDGVVRETHVLGQDDWLVRRKGRTSTDR